MHARGRSVSRLFPGSALASIGLAIVFAAVARPAEAAGGQVVPKTDGSFDGYFYALTGTGQDRFLTRYEPFDFDPNAILCGARVGEFAPGGPLPGPMRGDVRFEDPMNPGYPDFSPVGLIAVADPASLGSCSRSTAVPRFFTFGGGAGVPDPGNTFFLSAIEPQHGPGPNDVCGLLTDTNGPVLGYSFALRPGGIVRVPFNHFNEIIAFEGAHTKIREARAHGKPRFPGDPGVPAFYAVRPAADAALPHKPTDDLISITVVLDNPGPFVPVTANISIAADLDAIAPGKGLKEILRFFRPVGGGPAIMNPITIPDGRTVLLLEVPGRVPSRFVNRFPANVPLITSLRDPMTLDVISRRRDVLGLRPFVGFQDDGTAEAFFVVQRPNLPGDALNVRNQALDLPRTVPYEVTGLQVVGGEFGGSGLPGLDAVELRRDDFVFPGSPDPSAAGLLRTFGTANGIGEVPLGMPPTRVTLNILNLAVDPTVNPSLVRDFHVVGLLLPGETMPVTAIGADQTPETLLGNSTFTVSGMLPATRDLASNYTLRLLVNGQGGTLVGTKPDRLGGRSRPFVRVIGGAVRITLEE